MSIICITSLAQTHKKKKRTFRSWFTDQMPWPKTEWVCPECGVKEIGGRKAARTCKFCHKDVTMRRL